MRRAPQQKRSEEDWISLLDGVRVGRQWMTRHAPRLLSAWCDASTKAGRDAIAAEILRIAAEVESESSPNAGHDRPATSPGWEAIAERIDPRLVDGPDWPALSGALTRAAAAGYDVPTRLRALAAATPLPDRHPARELHWRLLDDFPGALPVSQADGPTASTGGLPGVHSPPASPQIHRDRPPDRPGDQVSPRARATHEGD